MYISFQFFFVIPIIPVPVPVPLSIQFHVVGSFCSFLLFVCSWHSFIHCQSFIWNLPFATPVYSRIYTLLESLLEIPPLLFVSVIKICITDFVPILLTHNNQLPGIYDCHCPNHVSKHHENCTSLGAVSVSVSVSVLLLLLSCSLLLYQYCDYQYHYYSFGMWMWLVEWNYLDNFPMFCISIEWGEVHHTILFILGKS